MHIYMQAQSRFYLLCPESGTTTWVILICRLICPLWESYIIVWHKRNTTESWQQFPERIPGVVIPDSARICVPIWDRDGSGPGFSVATNIVFVSNTSSIPIRLLLRTCLIHARYASWGTSARARRMSPTLCQSRYKSIHCASMWDMLFAESGPMSPVQCRL